MPIKNKSATPVSSCKWCICHLDSFVFLPPSLSRCFSHLWGHWQSQSAKSLANTAGLPDISASIIVHLRHWLASCWCGLPSSSPAATSYLSNETDAYGHSICIDKPNKITFICCRGSPKCQITHCMKKGKTFPTSLNKPCRIMLGLLGEPKADGFETGGRVFPAGLPSMRDPVCLTVELVLLKGCLKGPKPKKSVVMFAWLKEKQHSKA